MFGPAVGELIERAVRGASTEEDRVVMTELAPDRSFAAKEKLG